MQHYPKQLRSHHNTIMSEHTIRTWILFHHNKKCCALYSYKQSRKTEKRFLSSELSPFPHWRPCTEHLLNDYITEVEHGVCLHDWLLNCRGLKSCAEITAMPKTKHFLWCINFRVMPHSSMLYLHLHHHLKDKHHEALKWWRDLNTGSQPACLHRTS